MRRQVIHGLFPEHGAIVVVGAMFLNYCHIWFVSAEIARFFNLLRRAVETDFFYFSAIFGLHPGQCPLYSGLPLKSGLRLGSDWCGLKK